MKEQIIENLRHMPFAPSVQMQDVPRHRLFETESDETSESSDENA